MGVQVTNMNADVDTAGRIHNVGTGSDPEHGMTRVVLTSVPVKPVGPAGWRFTQTGTHTSGHPEGTAYAEPVSLATWKKSRVIELEQKKAAVTAAATSTGWDYSTELAEIDSEIGDLKDG